MSSEKLYPHVMQFYGMFSNVKYEGKPYATTERHFTPDPILNRKSTDLPFIPVKIPKYKK